MMEIKLFQNADVGLCFKNSVEHKEIKALLVPDERDPLTSEPDTLK